MAESWEMKAVHQQFDVFESLSTSYQHITLTELMYALQTTISEHLETNDRNPKKHIDVFCEILKTTGVQPNIRFSFCVIITNQNTGRNLSKSPVFAIGVGQHEIFIDMNCSVYNSWDEFMANNSLPACRFCFPVNGHYNVGEKLKIDFAKSPASYNVLSTVSRFSVLVLPIVQIAASYFFASNPTILKNVERFAPLLKMFGINISDVPDLVLVLGTLVQKFLSNPKQTINDIKLCTSRIYETCKTAASCVLEKAKNVVFNKVYNFIGKVFSKLYDWAPSWMQHGFAALVFAYDSHVKNDLLKIRNKLYSLGNSNRREVEGIFQNCRNESAYHIGLKDKDDDIHISTKELVTITKSVVDESNNKNMSLNDVKEMFQALSSMIVNEFNKQIGFYLRGLEAVKAYGGDERFNITVFNERFGVIGDPIEHYWREARQYVSDLPIMTLVKKKMEMKSEEKPSLVPVWQEPQNPSLGLYMVQNEGRPSHQMLLNTLREKVTDLDETHSVTETNGHTIFRGKLYTVLIHQEVLEHDTYKGCMYVTKNVK